MPLASTDIEYRLSGGASNSDVNASLGGIISSTEITSGSLHNLFDVVSSSEASAGDTEYRGIYIINNHAGSPIITAENVALFIQTLSPSADSTLAIALATEGINSTMATIANESTAPASSPLPTFVDSAASPNALSLPDLNPGEYIGIWLRRTITAGATAYTNDGPTLRCSFDTAG